MTTLTETLDLSTAPKSTTVLLPGDTIYGRISAGSDQDGVAVDLIAGQTYSFAAVTTGTNPLGDPFLRLLNGLGEEITSNDDSLVNHNAVIIYTALTTGRHYLEVSGFGGTTGSYGLNVTAGARPSFQTEMVAGVLIDHTKIWQDTTDISFSFRTSGNDRGTVFDSVFSGTQQASVVAILAHYAEIANLTFVNFGRGDGGTMVFANFSARNGIGAYAYGPGGANVSGDVWNNLYYNGSNFDLGSNFYETMLHEIGHAMGMSHPGLYDAQNGYNITYANSAQFTQDSESLTVMSYFDSDETGGTDLTAQTLGIADILALQNAYGVNMLTRAGDTTYGFGGSGIYNFNSNTAPKLTIWDGGGNDTLDVSGEGRAQRINLNEGTLSDVLGAIGNLGIAFGAMIENAFGGGGADTIFGNDLDNDLRGGAGADQLFGGAGADTLNGNTGSDVLVGGVGDDVFFVDNAADRIIEGVGGGYDIVRTSVNFTLAAGIAVQELRADGGGEISLTGNGSANRLVAGTGVNSLTGGGGRDVFVFDFGSITNIDSGISGNRDTITDFSQGIDRMDLSGIDANTGVSGDQAFANLGTSAAANRLWWLASGLDVILHGDVDGNATADFELLLRNLTSLNTADIIL